MKKKVEKKEMEELLNEKLKREICIIKISYTSTQNYVHTCTVIHTVGVTENCDYRSAFTV